MLNGAADDEEILKQYDKKRVTSTTPHTTRTPMKSGSNSGKKPVI
jgi:hypothetical protein